MAIQDNKNYAERGVMFSCSSVAHLSLASPVDTTHSES